MKYTNKIQKSVYRVAAKLATTIGLLGSSIPALAHHPLDGKTPSNLFEGVASGLAHPVIGIDHFAFLIAVGLLAIGQRNRYVMPLIFVTATMIGTALHLLSMNFIFEEAIIALSVVLFGGLIIASRQYQHPVLFALSGLAGLFHGYAYGEAIVGAEATPLVAYLFGFTLIQYTVIALSMWVGVLILNKFNSQKSQQFKRVVGSVIFSIGCLFFAQSVGAI